MYQIFLGKISSLSAGLTASELKDQAPSGARRAGWLAGRAMLSAVVSPLPERVVGQHGKPAFPADVRLWFNLSHSGDDIALLVSDEGEVGCDIEVLRPRPGWRNLAQQLFSAQEQAQLAAEPVAQQLAAFWRIWTLKEAIIKQRGESAWQMASIDSTAPSALSVSALQVGGLSLAVCTPTPFALTVAAIQIQGN
ncbi:4'-phosphopantetheinyl transferase [Pantoea allii]|uniref:4'-phosphopantetheinyl transferase n=1 Tax=Pantoea allii TaxID=574096 RepID=A0A2V2BKI2_9GAMM|nr:4'-phosphopantetheinyl transferase AcpT [Pantoea allii]PWK99366.1 4'-phosphopantetheinyl transferase [Pantoea allii]